MIPLILYILYFCKQQFFLPQQEETFMFTKIFQNKIPHIMSGKLIAPLLTFLLALAFSERSECAIIVDSKTGLPLQKASVLDKKGKLIGFCSENGELPDIPATAYPLSIRCIGYKTVTIERPTNERIALEEKPYYLPELMVDRKKHQVLHIIGYLREYSTLESYYDTVFLFREKTVDFMIPTKQVKKYEGWTRPRVLESKSYYHFTNMEGLDSVSKYYEQIFSWSDLAGIFRSIELPENLKNTDFATDTVFGKYSPSSIWRKEDENVFLRNDMLADKEDHKWTPDHFKLFSMAVDFTKFITNYTLTDVNSSTVFADNISMLSYNIESQGRVLDLRRLFHSDDPIFMNTYAELYITDREYMSIKQAEKWEKDPTLGDDIGINPPPEAPELEPAIKELIDRVNNFDYDQHRLDTKTDRFLHPMKKFDKKRKKKKFPLSF